MTPESAADESLSLTPPQCDNACLAIGHKLFADNCRSHMTYHKIAIAWIPGEDR